MRRRDANRCTVLDVRARAQPEEGALTVMSGGDLIGALVSFDAMGGLGYYLVIAVARVLQRSNYTPTTGENQP